MNISQLRSHTTQNIWGMTRRVPLLDHTNWTTEVVDMLKDFENSILLEMKVRGWDGIEDLDHIQWTFTGALFYSIIVITTIGYGHISPKTQAGKVVTIFYAIFGIPLMLLCLSSIGDVMASSFRFLYWRVCCYVCTRPPTHMHRHRRPSRRRSARNPTNRTSAYRKPLQRAHSDTDCRYRDSGYSSGRVRPPVSFPPHTTYLESTRNIEIDDHPPGKLYEKYKCVEDEDEDFPKITLPLKDLEAAIRDLENHQRKSMQKNSQCSKSFPRPSRLRGNYGLRRSYEYRKPYAVDHPEVMEMHDLDDVDYENYRQRKHLDREKRRSRKEEEYYNYRNEHYDFDEDEYDFEQNLHDRRWNDQRLRRGRSEYYEYDPVESDIRRGRRARSAMYDGEQYRRGDGYGRNEIYRRSDIYGTVESYSRGGHRRRIPPLRRLRTIDDSYQSSRYKHSPDCDEWSDELDVISRRGRTPGHTSRQPEVRIVPISPEPSENGEIKPVPIWLCVFLVASYIVAGTFLFKRWEGWDYLDAAYFCFITLTTIGFGDFVPAQGQQRDARAAVHSIALCSLYVLFGIALLAMSFNLVQEEVRANVAAAAARLGIIKTRDRRHGDY